MIIPGDGIGPEIMDEAVYILDFIISKKNLKLDYEFGTNGRLLN